MVTTRQPSPDQLATSQQPDAARRVVGLVAKHHRPRCPSKGNSVRSARVGSTRPHRWKARWDAAEPLTCANLPVGRTRANRLRTPCVLRGLRPCPAPPLSRRPPSLPHSLHELRSSLRSSGRVAAALRAAAPGDFVPTRTVRALGRAAVDVVRIGSVLTHCPDTHSSTCPVARLPLAARVSPTARRIRAGNSRCSFPTSWHPKSHDRGKKPDPEQRPSNGNGGASPGVFLSATRVRCTLGAPLANPGERLAFALAGAIAWGDFGCRLEGRWRVCKRNSGASAYPETMRSEEARTEQTTPPTRATMLLIFAASMALSEAIWHWLPAAVPIYRAVLMALAALSIVALWGGELRLWWKHRRSH